MLVLLAAASADNSLNLPGDGVGLLHHPGMFSILVGDVLLFVLSQKCIAMTRKVGRRLPSKNKQLTRRYFRKYFWQNALGGRNNFFRLFLFTAMIGALAVLDQSVKLWHAEYYYGHDTFDSIRHIWSFAANRINLIISWCFVVPIFASYTLIYVHCVRTVVCRTREKGLAAFYVQHPDNSGGYAFFGALNVWFGLGAVVILLETLLLFYTHRRVEGSYIWAATLGASIILFVSMFPMLQVRKTLHQLQRRLIVSGFVHFGDKPATLGRFILHYQVRFSAYDRVSAMMMTTVRAVSFIPAAYHVWQTIAGL